MMPRVGATTFAQRLYGALEAYEGWLWVGIDPGVSGAITLMGEGGPLLIEHMPQTELQIYHSILELRQCQTVRTAIKSVVVEKVWSTPFDGHVGAFTFGYNYGCIKTSLFAAGLGFVQVTPQAWQKALTISPRKKGESKPQWKRKLSREAKRLYPAHPIWRQWKIPAQVKVSDSILIATYARMKTHGT